jgi:hypothetical protein
VDLLQILEKDDVGSKPIRQRKYLDEILGHLAFHGRFVPIVIDQGADKAAIVSGSIRTSFDHKASARLPAIMANDAIEDPLARANLLLNYGPFVLHLGICLSVIGSYRAPHCHGIFNGIRNVNSLAPFLTISL